MCQADSLLKSDVRRADGRQMELGDSVRPDTSSGSYVQRPSPAQLAETLPPVRSRWQKGTLTFGPVGRIAWTAVLLTPPVWYLHRVWQYGFLSLIDIGLAFSTVFVVTWTFFLVPRALREVWAKEIVHVPQPITSPTRLMSDDHGNPVITLAEYVAGQAEASAPHLP